MKGLLTPLGPRDKQLSGFLTLRNLQPFTLGLIPLRKSLQKIAHIVAIIP